MSERERFEAAFPEAWSSWDEAAQQYLGTVWPTAWAVWQAARSGQAASGSSQGARSDDQNGVGQPEAPTADRRCKFCNGGASGSWCPTAEGCAAHGCHGECLPEDQEAPTAAALVAECAPYLKEGETPLQRIQRDAKDMDALLTLLSREKRRSMGLAEKLAARSGAGSEEGRDAARYRWLRPKMSTSRTVYDGHIGPWHINFPTMTSTDDGQPAELLDTAIDAAIAGSEEAQPDRSEES